MADNPISGAVEGGGNLLTKKFGGVPFWGILLVVGGGIYIGKRYSNSQGQTLDAADASSSDAIIATQPTSPTGVVYGGVGAQAGTGVTSPTLPTDAENKQSWLTKAAQLAASKGFGQYETSIALRAYANGNAITDPRQLQIVNSVVAAVGEAPGLTFGPTGGDSTRSVIGYVTEAGTIKIYEVNFTRGTRQWMLNPLELTRRREQYRADPANFSLVPDQSMSKDELSQFRDVPQSDPIRGQ